MLPTYKATLRGNRLEWIGEAPEGDAAVPVHVTLLEQPVPRQERGAQMADALRQLADAGGLSAIPDPVSWQREQRRERALPGRSR